MARGRRNNPSRSSGSSHGDERRGSIDDAASMGRPDRQPADLSSYEPVEYEEIDPAADAARLAASRPAAVEADDGGAQKPRDESMSELDQTSGTTTYDPAVTRTAEPPPAAPRRRGGWLAGFIGGLLGSAVLLAGAGYYLYEYGPGRPALSRFTAAETAARNAETAAGSLRSQIDQLQAGIADLRGALDRTTPALETVNQRVAAAEQTNRELASTLQQVTGRVDNLNQEIGNRLDGLNQELGNRLANAGQETNTRLEALATKLAEVERAQPADVVDKGTVNDIAVKQAGLEQSQTRLDGAIARLEQLVAQGLEASNQQAGALRIVVDQARTQIDQINTQLREITALRERITANQQAIETNRTAIEATNQQVANVRTGLDQRLAEVVDRLGQLDAARERGVGLSVAVHSLEQALDTGEPFESTLSLVNQLGQGDPAVSEAAGRLQPLAGSGVPTLAELSQRLDEVQRSLQAPSQAEPQDWLTRTRANLGGLVDLRPVGEGVPGGKAVIDARQALLQQNLDGAIEAITSLAQQGNQQAAAWLETARQRQSAAAAIASLREHVKTVLAQQG